MAMVTFAGFVVVSNHAFRATATMQPVLQSVRLVGCGNGYLPNDDIHKQAFVLNPFSVNATGFYLWLSVP